MNVEDLYIYLESCPNAPEKETLKKVIDYLNSLQRIKSASNKRFDDAMKGVI